MIFSVKCLDRNCQTNARCVSNKCACKFGFVDISGFCEGRKNRDAKHVQNLSIIAFHTF